MRSAASPSSSRSGPTWPLRRQRITAAELEAWRRDDPSLQIVDVRNPTERSVGSIDGSVNLPLPTLLDRLGDLDPHRPTLVYCAGGYRSATAASLLRSKGFTTVAELFGGYNSSLDNLGSGTPAPAGR